MPKSLNITGQRFGRLVASAPSHQGRQGRWYWHCQCDCGRTSIAQARGLVSGNTHSCGCFNKDRTRETRRTHGRSRTALYQRWVQMLKRCYNEQQNSYKNYGGRGITVCEHWHSFENFLADMGEPPPGLSIER